MSKINSNIKDDFQVVLLLSCFVGHPVPEVGFVVQDPSSRKRRTYTETRWQRKSGLSKRTRDLKIKKNEIK